MTVTHLSLVGFILLGILVLALPLVVFFSQQQQKIEQHAAGFTPTLLLNEVVTNNCSTASEGCGWSQHKPRIVRTSDGIVYIVYITQDASGAFQDQTWHLVKRVGASSWQEIGSGAAGSEPSALLRQPNDDLWVIAFPQNAYLQVTHFTRQANGTYTQSSQTIPGFGTTHTDATYFGAGVNALGDMVIAQNSWSNPDTAQTNPQFTTDAYWTVYNHTAGQWSPRHDSPMDYRHGYIYPLPHDDGITVGFAADVDDQRSKFPGMAACTPGQNCWAVIAGADYYQGSLPSNSLTFSALEDAFNSTSTNFIIINIDDAYVDTQGRTHVLYLDTVKKIIYHATIQNGRVIKNAPIPQTSGWWFARIFQDATGRFYLMDEGGGQGGGIRLYPGSAGDTDGTQFDSSVTMPIQIDYSGCTAPHLAVPRGGTPLANYIDGFYLSGSNCQTLAYFRLQLNNSTNPTMPPIANNPTPEPNHPSSGPTSTPQPGSTVFNVTICPHGLGNCGDNANPSSGGNTDPLHTTRNITLTIFDTNNNQVAVQQGQVTYASQTQNFQGTIPVSNLQNGNYLITQKMDGFLGKQIPGVVSVSQGQTITLSPVSLFNGDINNDNQLDIQDYNILISCFGSKQQTSSCIAPPTASPPGADIDDDGVVDGADYNLFLREINVQHGR